MRKIPQPQNPNPMDLRVQRRHKKREGKVERDTARVFYMRLSPVRLKIQSIGFCKIVNDFCLKGGYFVFVWRVGT